MISSREEAELAVESCTPLLRRGGRRALLFDIGGGSTELAWVRLPPGAARPELVGYVSLPIGVVTLAERIGAAGFDCEAFQDMVRRGLRQPARRSSAYTASARKSARAACCCSAPRAR